MTSDRLFSVAADAAAVRAGQASELLDAIKDADVRPSGSYNSHTYNYADAFKALRTGAVANGQALLAVHSDLARIANALEMLAKTPAAIEHLAGHVAAAGQSVKDGLAEVSGEIHELTATLDQGVEFADSTASATGTVALGVHELTDAVLRLSEPRPRWWQRRRRRILGQVADTASTQDYNSSAGVCEFLIEVCQQDQPGTVPLQEVLGRTRFYAEPHAAVDTARTLLPGLCGQMDVPANPDRVYGRVFRRVPDDADACYVDAVFLPGATVIETPPGGF